MTGYDHPSFQDAYRRWSPPELHASLPSILLATVAGAYVCLKALELLGYPVWRWFDTMPRRGGMLSSMLGLNSEGLLHKGVRGLTGALSSAPRNVPPGLGNISNSCYQNSVIQGLAALPSLHDYLARITTEHPSFTPETANGALHALITKLNNPENQGQNFWIRGKLKSMSTFTQQDAQEYYSRILDDLDTELKKASNSRRRSSVSWLEATMSLSDRPTTVSHGKGVGNDAAEPKPSAAEQPNFAPNPLDGLLAQRVGCTSCGYSEGLSLISFNCITVSLGANHGYDVRECLDEYTKLEYIDGVECAKCTLLKLQKTLAPLATANPASSFETRLNLVSEIIDDERFDDNTLVKTLNIPKKNWVQISKSKQIVIARAPKSIVLHINRSIFDEMTGVQYKNTAAVSYPRTLDLGNWCLGNSPSGSGQPDVSLEEWPRDPKQSMLRENHETTTTSPFQYRLRAAVTHFGSHGNGHYVCYRPYTGFTAHLKRGPGNFQELQGEQWWRFSDDTVYAVPEDQAHQGNVFMLFYERVDTATPLQSLETEPISEMCPVIDDAPLPRVNIHLPTWQVADVEDAAAVPLPDDDELFDLNSFNSPNAQSPNISESSRFAEDKTPERSSASSIPPPQIRQNTLSETTSQDMETEMSEAESEDAQLMQLTSEADAELASPPTPQALSPAPPPLMRTAGSAASRRQGSRQSLPLVSAT